MILNFLIYILRFVRTNRFISQIDNPNECDGSGIEILNFSFNLCFTWCRSFLCGGSTGFFIYGYCLYYYYARSDMSGFMQTSFFFGYMACICYAFFLMLGMVGFRAALLFVRHIYRSIKCE